MPGVSGLEDIVWYPLTGGWNLKSKSWILYEQYIIEVAVEGGVEKSSSPADFDSAARIGTSSNPSSIDEPALGIILTDLLRKKVSVDTRMTRHEWGSEAGREGRLWLGHAYLSACDLSCVTGHEVVGCLLWTEFGEWWQHTEGIASQEHDILRVSSHRIGSSVLDVLYWV